MSDNEKSDAAVVVPEKLSLWKKQRTITKTNCDRELLKCQGFLQAGDRAKEQDLRVSRSKLQDYLQRLSELDEKVLPFMPDANIDIALADADQRQETVSEIMFKVDASLTARETKQTQLPDKAVPSSGSSSDYDETARLPKLSISPFSGNPLKWREFLDSFNVSVHLRSKLFKIQKFQYLKSYLEGGALRLLDGCSLSDATYDTVVAVLKNRYDHPELCINAHLDNMIYMSECQNTVQDIQETFDVCEAQIRGLVALGMAEEAFERVFVPLILFKFPRSLRIDLNRKNGVVAWTLVNLRQYIRDEIAARNLGLLTVGGNNSGGGARNGNNNSPRDRQGQSTKRPKEFAKSGTASGFVSTDRKQEPVRKPPKYPCAYCQSNKHFPEDCDKFLTANDRRGVLKQDQCLLCLGTNHRMSQCKSSRTCKFCGAKQSHHQSLCFKKFGHQKSSGPENAGGLNIDAQPFVPAGCLLAPGSTEKQPDRGVSVLGTAVTTIRGQLKSATVRIVLDSCSTRSFARLDVLKQVGAKLVTYENLGLAGLESTKRRYDTFGCYELTIVCADGDQVPVAVNGLKTISCPVDKHSLSPAQYPLLRQFTLADPPGNTTGPVEIDVLIGLDHYYRFVGDIAVRLSSTLVLLGTKLGYIPNGSSASLKLGQQSQTALLAIRGDSPDETLDQNLKQMFELEEVAQSDLEVKADDVIAAEKPYKSDRDPLPTNYALASGRLKGLLRRTDGPTLEVYDQTIKDQFHKNIIEIAPREPDGDVHYIPHHCIVKPERATTKLRIVYDASARMHKGYPSLNSSMYSGPSLIADLCGLIMRFSQHPIGVISDIEKAFLQIGIKPDHRDVTRFLWVHDLNKPPSGNNLVVYRFTRVLFGITASPYMLAATIKHHLISSGTTIADQILPNCYVDNVITCFENPDDAYRFYVESKSVFDAASMNLREWSWNCELFIDRVNLADRSKSQEPTVLGLKWDLAADTLGVQSPTEVETCSSKRHLLQRIAQVFDPCGFLTPVVVIGKIILQKLWLLKIDWDEVLPDDSQRRGNDFLLEVRKIHVMAVDRVIGNLAGSVMELHCFVDASQDAYAAVVYQRSELKSMIVCRLLFSKVKVSPAKKVLTIPRLELSALALGCRLITFVNTELNCLSKRMFVWSDSQCCLHWVDKTAQRPVFVKNRVEQIKKFEGLTLRYVPTDANPGDIPTRGLSASSLRTCSLGWNGPDWLSGPEQMWPLMPTSLLPNDYVDMEADGEPISLASTASPSSFFDLSGFSTLNKAIRVFAWVICFVNILRGGSKVGQQRHITVDEHARSLRMIIRNVQEEFSVNFPVDFSSAVKQRNLFLDPTDLFRCRGRLDFADAPYDLCFPVYIPRQSNLARLIVQEKHSTLGHAGVSHVLNELRSQFWIPKDRMLIKSVIHRCYICKRWKGGSYYTPNPPPLPAFRVAEQPSFHRTGVDYLGPLTIRADSGLQNVWVCLFSCSSTRAIHLEVISDMSTEQFLFCLRRFIAHYRKPALIVADNAKYFKLASKITHELWLSVLDDSKVRAFSGQSAIEWKFIPELAPWMGGQEGYRAITPNDLSRKGSDLLPITSSAESIDDPDFIARPDTKSSLILKWKRMDSRLNQFWSQWRKGYLTSLQGRHWKPNNRGTAKVEPRVGSVVLIGDPGVPRGQWTLGRILRVHHRGGDNIVRSVTTLTSKGKELRRPLKYVYPFELQEEVNDDGDHTLRKMTSILYVAGNHRLSRFRVFDTNLTFGDVRVASMETAYWFTLATQQPVVSDAGDLVVLLGKLAREPSKIRGFLTDRRDFRMTADWIMHSYEVWEVIILDQISQRSAFYDAFVAEFSRFPDPTSVQVVATDASKRFDSFIFTSACKKSCCERLRSKGHSYLGYNLWGKLLYVMADVVFGDRWIFGDLVNLVRAHGINIEEYYLTVFFGGINDCQRSFTRQQRSLEKLRNFLLDHHRSYTTSGRVLICPTFDHPNVPESEGYAKWVAAELRGSGIQSAEWSGRNPFITDGRETTGCFIDYDHFHVSGTGFRHVMLECAEYLPIQQVHYTLHPTDELGRVIPFHPAHPNNSAFDLPSTSRDPPATAGRSSSSDQPSSVVFVNPGSRKRRIIDC